MNQIARVVPVKSREALQQLCDEIRQKMPHETQSFFNSFGTGYERWYFQEIDGKPFLISVTDSTNMSAGYDQYAHSSDPFFVWFSDRIKEISDIDLRENPTGATSELMLEMSN